MQSRLLSFAKYKVKDTAAVLLLGERFQKGKVKAVNFVFTVDLEMDVDKNHVHTGLYHNLDNLDRVLEVLDRFGAKGTWFATPDVILNRPSVVKDLLSGGHEIGCHVHPEYFTLKGNLKGTRCKLFLSQFSEQKQTEMIRMAKLTAMECLPYKPVSFRAGRFGMNDDTVRALDHEEFYVDSSITPGINWDGADHLTSVNGPSFLSQTLLEIPTTVASSFLGPYWLRSSTTGLTGMKYALGKTARKIGPVGRSLVFVHFLHSYELAEPNPYIPASHTLRNLTGILEFLMGSQEVKFNTMAKVRSYFAPRNTLPDEKDLGS